MQLEMYYNFFLGFWSSAPLLGICGVFLALKNGMRAVVDED